MQRVASTLSYAGSVAVITGSSGAIGRGVACSLAAAGYKLALLGRNSNQLDNTLAAVKECSKSDTAHRIYQGDVCQYQSVDSIINSISRDLGPIHVLVNAAGVNKDALIARVTEEDIDSLIRTNLTASIYASKAFVRALLRAKAQQGRIINIGSVVGTFGNVGQSVYSASKAGLVGLTKSLAKELGPKNCTVNMITPGFIDSGMTRAMSEADRQALLSRIPLGRFGSTEDVGNLVAFLASDQAKYINGQVLGVDGGLQL